MTSRQRFRTTMRFGKPDRLPYFEEGIRDDVLKSWHRQGLSRNKNLSDLFPTDNFEEIVLNIDPLPDLNKYPTSTVELEILKHHLNPDDPARLPKKWKKILQQWRQDEPVLFLRVHRGFFLSMGVYDWERFSDVMTLLVENPDFVRETMQIQGEFAANFFDKILKDIEIDAAIFSEPIGGNEGPLISPSMYEEFVLKSYKPLINVLTSHGVETIIFRTYANTRLIIPQIQKYGFNCLWACETNSDAMDYRTIRRDFGRNLRLIGGIDLDALRYDKETIRREIQNIVPPLISDGGYIPLADGRVRKDINYENYLYYRRLLEKILND